MTTITLNIPVGSPLFPIEVKRLKEKCERVNIKMTYEYSNGTDNIHFTSEEGISAELAFSLGCAYSIASVKSV